MPDYEIRVAGPIGPAVASSLPGFTFLKVPTLTILAGTISCPDELLTVINLLKARGLEMVDHRIDQADGADRAGHPGDKSCISSAEAGSPPIDGS